MLANLLDWTATLLFVFQPLAQLVSYLMTHWRPQRTNCHTQQRTNCHTLAKMKRMVLMIRGNCGLSSAPNMSSCFQLLMHTKANLTGGLTSCLLSLQLRSLAVPASLGSVSLGTSLLPITHQAC